MKQKTNLNRFILMYTPEEIAMMADHLIGCYTKYKKDSQRYNDGQTISSEVEEALAELGLED
jgi:hypothetical protein